MKVADLAAKLMKAEAALAAYDAAADKFIEKCESERARSVTTYAELKAARAMPR
jgi:hypothetical protein